MKRFFTFFLFVLVAFDAFGQTTIFSENIGTPSGTTAITANTFQNSGTLTYSNGGATNSADCRSTSPSTGYTGASAGGNVFFSSTSGSYGFAIEGINAANYTSLTLQFGYRKESASALPTLALEYWNGSAYVAVSYSFSQAANASIAWYLSPTISLPAAAQINGLKLRWVKSGTNSVRIDDIILKGTLSSSPTLSVSPSSLSAFSTTVVGQNSTSQTFNLSGSNFTNASGNITVTAPNTDFQVSSDNNTFGATATIPFTGNALASTPVYVRFTPQSEGAKSGNITFSDPGGVTTLPTVSVSGTGACTTPSLVTSFSGTNGNTQSILNWTNGSCFDEMLVVARAGSAVSFTPSGDGSAYTANAAFGSGTDVGSSQFVVYKGTGTTQTVTSLTNGTTYHFAVYTRRGSNWSAAVAANATPVASTNASDYFRSRTSGDWATPNTWESSSDNNTWITATLAPTSTSTAINIRNSHTVTITSNIAVDDVTIENGGIVSLNSTNGTLNLDNGTAVNDLDIQNGGLLTISGNQSYSTTIRPSTGANINIQTGGKITFTGSGGGYSALGSSSTNYTWNDGAIFEWNSTTTPSMSNVTIFPNANASTVPILRVSSAWGSPGGGSPTIINGKIEVNASFTWNTSSGGTKTFRNGIIGTATMSQSTGSVWQITGTSAEIGGGVTLSLGTNGLSINSGSITTVSANTTINSGTLTIASGGTIDIGTSTLSGSGGFTLSGGALIKTSNATGIAGSVTTTSKSFSSSANYEFKGSATGSFTTSPTANTVNNLTINNTLGISLDMPLSVANTLTLTSGKLTLGSNNLIIGAGGTISGGSATSYVATTGTGTLKVATGGLLPIGTASVYAPVTVTNTGAADNFSARVKSVAANGDFTCNTDVTKTVKLQWDVNEDVAGGSIATLIFQWAASEEGSSFNRNSAIFVSHCNGTAYDYVKSATLGGSNPYTATATDISAFSPFVIQNDNPLSAELLDFKAKPIANTAVLSWQTANEKDNAFFGIEHATNGNDFREIAQVKGNGTTTQLTDYQYIHTTPSVGANYYRLRQVDFNGTTTHSPIRSVWVSGNGKISLFPTVSSHEITLRTDDTAVNQTYEIYNMLGERVLFGEMQGQKTILISELSRGVYILKIKGENLKFVKE